MPTVHRYERTERVAHLVRDVVASQMERLGEPFEGIVITGVEVDRELTGAAVYYDARDEAAATAAGRSFDEHRHRIQRALAAQTSLRRTPTLRFCRDTSAVSADRIERLLSQIAAERDDAAER